MRFRYLLDPLFLLCFVLYFVNRWLLKSLWPRGFFHSHFNDLICIPFWVPIMLFALRKLRLRSDDAAPRSYEVLIPLLLWSVIFELVLPRLGPFRRLATPDHEDILFYCLGALAATVFWRVWYEPRWPGHARGPMQADDLVSKA